METIRLSALPSGASAAVTALHTPEPMRRRLMDLGLTEGSSVTCLGHSPWGSAARYTICGAVIALRRADSQTVEVRCG